MNGIWDSDLIFGRDPDNNLSFVTSDQLDITIGGVTTSIKSISTGTSDNDKLITQGYVDDAISAINFWTRTSTTLEPLNVGDSVDLGAGSITTATANFTGAVNITNGAGASPILLLQDGDNFNFTLQKWDLGPGVITNNEGPIYLRPSGNTDDYVSVKTASNICYIGRDDDDDLVQLEANLVTINGTLIGVNVRLTPIGGIAILMINDILAASVKGLIVQASPTVDEGARLTANDDIDPIGIILEDDVPIGEPMWVVVAGIAEVRYGTTVTRGTFSRVAVVADSVPAGQAVNEALPTSPFAIDKHFQEIGHPIESIGSPGLAKTALHFN